MEDYDAYKIQFHQQIEQEDIQALAHSLKLNAIGVNTKTYYAKLKICNLPLAPFLLFPEVNQVCCLFICMFIVNRLFSYTRQNDWYKIEWLHFTCLKGF